MNRFAAAKFSSLAGNETLENAFAALRIAA